MQQAAGSKKGSPTAASKYSPRLLAGIFVALFFIAGLLFRVVFPYDHVFVGDWIKFTTVDAWYHMRIVDNLVHNFPHLNSFDPYLLYPAPMLMGVERFFDYLVATIAWIMGLGAPAQRTVDMVGIYLPAILGVLVVIPVYFLGKALVNRWVGVMAAGLMAFAPGEFMARSIIGQTDHHVFEVLCSTTAMLFIILALQQARRRQIAFSPRKSLSWPVIARPLLYSVLAGILLGLYLNAWLGALLFVFILFAYVVIQFIIDYARGVNSGYLCFVGAVTFAVTLIITLLLPHTTAQVTALLIALVSTVALGILSPLMLVKGVKAGHYVGILIGLGLVELAVFYAVKADLLQQMLSSFAVLVPTGARLTITEARSILFPGGEFSLEVVWLNFTTGSILALVGLGMFIYSVIKKGEADIALLVVWSFITLVITLLMRRFGYYFAVNVAVLTGYVAWRILQYFGLREPVAQPAPLVADTGKKARQKAKKREAGAQAGLFLKAVGVIVVFFLVLFPNIIYARDMASATDYIMSDAWCQALDWLRSQAPEPYGSADFYYGRYDQPFTQPPSAYGVAAHWDYGYWITRMGRRSPIANPGIWSTRDTVSRYFLSKDEASAVAQAQATGSKYAVVTFNTALPERGYETWLQYTGMDHGDYYDVYVQRSGGKIREILLFYPEYYRSLAVRLYNFNGNQVAPQEAIVVSYVEKVTADGRKQKEMIKWDTFPNYDAALAFLKKQPPGNYKIGGKDPFFSPIPLEPLTHYKLMYSSPSSVVLPDGSKFPEVKIFQYLP